MKIQPFVTGPYGTCTYVLYEYDGNACVIIDAPFPFEKPLSFIKDNSLKAEAVYLTHGHFDHIFGLAEIREEYPSIPIFIGKEDLGFVENGYEGTIKLLESFDPFFLSRYAFKVIPDMPEDFSTYSNTAGFFSVIKTPGHTAGSVSLYSKEEKILFTGDTLFQGSAGRTDIGGNQMALFRSLRELAALPSDTLVFPGHGMMTNIGTEISSNPYMHF